MLGDHESLHILRRVALGARRVLQRREHVRLRILDDQRILGVRQQVENEPLELQRVRLLRLDQSAGVVDDAAPSCGRRGTAARP